MAAARVRFQDVRVGDEIPPLSKVVKREDVKVKNRKNREKLIPPPKAS